MMPIVVGTLVTVPKHLNGKRLAELELREEQSRPYRS